jgi:hypothetical protein
MCYKYLEEVNMSDILILGIICGATLGIVVLIYILSIATGRKLDELERKIDDLLDKRR